MDEPCSALDPIATKKFEELIYELKENFTIIIVTHSMQQAARVSQRTAYFSFRKLIEVGATDKIFTTPQHKLTESYVPEDLDKNLSLWKYTCKFTTSINIAFYFKRPIMSIHYMFNN